MQRHWARSRTSWLSAAVIVAGSLLAVAGASAQSNRILTCKDARGQTLATDPSDPRCYKPPLTSDEKAALDAERERQNERYLACKAEERSNQSLVNRYPDQARHEAARQQALESVAAATRGSELRVRKLLEDRKGLLVEAEFYPPEKMPPKLKRDLETNGALLEAQKQAAAKQEEEAAQINSFYDQQLKKLKVLWTPHTERHGCVAPRN